VTYRRGHDQALPGSKVPATVGCVRCDHHLVDDRLGGAGWLIYQTVMAGGHRDGITNTGTTFNSWIESFRNAVPAGFPSDPVLLDIADTLQRYSGDSLVSAGHQVHDAIFQLPSPLRWSWRCRRSCSCSCLMGRGGGGHARDRAALAFREIASMTGRSDQRALCSLIARCRR